MLAVRKSTTALTLPDRWMVTATEPPEWMGESAAACFSDSCPCSTAATSWFRWEPRFGYYGSCFSGMEKSSGPSPSPWAMGAAMVREMSRVRIASRENSL